MRYIVAPDSYKGSLSATDAADIMRGAIESVDASAQIQTKPMADGGEGTLDVLLQSYPEHRWIERKVTGPTGIQRTVAYGIVAGRHAIIECAAIAGLLQVETGKQHPDLLTTYGIGEVIGDALDSGCDMLTIGIGGSATMDAGFGMLMALGLEAHDVYGRRLKCRGRDMLQVDRISTKNLDHRLQDVQITIVSDVDNPLTGNSGASFVFGGQKGASEVELDIYDRGMQSFGTFLENALGGSWQMQEGSGAAGGLGFALKAIGGKMVSGAAFIAQHIGLEDEMEKTDIVFTGEGKSDRQTMYGKVPGYVAQLAKRYGKPIHLVSGSVEDAPGLHDLFSGCWQIGSDAMTVEQNMKQAPELLYARMRQAIESIVSGG